MARTSKADRVAALLDLHGRTYAEEIGFDASRNTPQPLFRLLCAALLFSARISSNIAVAAAKALAQQGWTSAEKLAASTWEQRARTLNEAGYARYDERTSAMLGDTAELALERYGGDLRKLREDAGRDPDRERKLLKRFKGLGDVGVDIFFREVQVAWGELFPFAGERALRTAGELNLPDDPAELAKLVGRQEFPRLAAALIRSGLAKDTDEIKAAAEG